MAPRSPSLSQLQGVYPVYLLHLIWFERDWYFSTEPISVTNAARDSLSFLGSLEDPDFEEHEDDEGGSLPLGLVFPGLDIAQEAARGRHLDGARGELSFVLVDASGTPQQTWEQRFRVTFGRAVQPQYAFPDEPAGFAQFSLEEPPSEDAATLLEPSATINSATWTNRDTENDGKPYPLVIGRPGRYQGRSGGYTRTRGSPAYKVHIADGLVLIAGHEVAATSVRLYDSDGVAEIFSVTHQKDGLGRVCAIVDVSAAATLDPTSTTFFVAWDDSSGGGLVNPFRGGTLEGAGDVAAYILSRGTLGADLEAWRALSDRLNQFLIATYVNDPQLTPFEWFRDNLAPVLQLQVRNGSGGLYPLPRIVEARGSDAVADLVEGPDFTPDGPLTTEDGPTEVRNAITIRFAPDAENDTYRGTFTLTGVPQTGDVTEFPDEYSLLSQSRFGVRAETIETEVIYDAGTAARILRDAVRVRGFPRRTRPYAADVSWGYLRLGDLVRLTSDTLHLTDRPCRVIARRWDGALWRFLLEFLEDVPRDGRPVV